MGKDNWRSSNANLQEWSNKTEKKNASLAFQERGDEARSAVWDNKELTTNPFSIKHTHTKKQPLY